uniref:CHK kinase-like domain-containing protein n=1 Tax=Cuerna arida TaxID=1464854 RepID=A0A1B6ENF4_9HEMI
MMADPKLRDILDKVTNSGRFGDGVKFIDLIPSVVEGEDHFASAVIFAEVKLKNGSCDKLVKVVIKQQQQNAFVRDMMNTDTQFYNEALMYNEILPFMDKNGIVEDSFPKSIYCNATLGDNYEDDIMIFEDLKQYGYKLTAEKLFLDFDHCAVALKKLGRFHALSYLKKQENLERFLSVVGKLKETRWDNNQRDDSNQFLQMSVQRGMLPLMEEGGDHKEILEEIMSHALEDPHSLMRGLCEPEEPVAVLCHGDFCRNNMVFRYDADGKPEDVRFFDMATARYASPAIDLSFFLFLNTSAELRRARWDELLQVYHDSLVSALPECRVPSLDTVRLEVTRRAFYGYVLCSFFLPMMLDPGSKTELDDFASFTPAEMEASVRSKGGQQATDYVTDIVRDLIRMKSL